MKKQILIIAIMFSFTLPMISQLNFDLKVGITPASTPASAGIIVNRHNPMKEFGFNMVHSKPQYYVAAKAHLELGSPFFIEGGVAYTRRSSMYEINYRVATEANPVQNMLMSESENLLQFPVDFGVNLGVVDVTSGLTLSRNLSKTSELNHLEGFQQNDPTFQVGWQMGARYAIKRAMIGVEYQGTLNRVGHGMSVNQQSLEIMQVPGKFVFSVQYRF